MELVAGSLDVEVDEYLHAGYLSAGPRTFADVVIHDHGRAGVNLIDVRTALQLKDPAPPPSQPADQTAVGVSAQPAPLAPASMAGDALLLATLFFFFAFVIGLYYRRIRRVERPGWRPWLLAVVPVLAVVVLVGWVFPAYEEHRLNSLPPPWAYVPVRDYEHPEAATEAILHGLIANAIAGTEVTVRQLTAIQHEVAFPVPADQYSPGMSYAKQTYGRDGWGREFHFVPLANGSYRIASAGEDGSFGTPDDIVLVTAEKDTYNWEQLVNGVYVRRTPALRNEYTCFVHRVSHANFRWMYPDIAQRLTGTELFDTFPFDEFPAEWVEPSPIVTQLAEHEKSRGQEEQADPLFFVQIMSTEDG